MWSSFTTSQCPSWWFRLWSASHGGPTFKGSGTFGERNKFLVDLMTRLAYSSSFADEWNHWWRRRDHMQAGCGWAGAEGAWGRGCLGRVATHWFEVPRAPAHHGQADLCFLVQRVILGKQSNFLLYGTDMIMYWENALYNLYVIFNDRL